MNESAVRAVDVDVELESCYEEIQPYLKKELETLREALIALPEDASAEQRLKRFEECVNALNAVEEIDGLTHGIDTIEREALCEALYKLGDAVGLDSETYYVDDWRDW